MTPWIEAERERERERERGRGREERGKGRERGGRKRGEGGSEASVCRSKGEWKEKEKEKKVSEGRLRVVDRASPATSVERVSTATRVCWNSAVAVPDSNAGCPPAHFASLTMVAPFATLTP